MRRRQLFLLVLFIAVIGSQATDNRKLSSYVQSLAKRQQEQPLLSRATDASRQPKTLTAFVRIDADKADELWRTFGCKPYAMAGDIAIVSIPVSSLGPLSDHAAVHRIEASPSGRACMDTTAVIVGADKLHLSPSNLHLPSFTGSGVIVGIMDIGFDLSHPNFLDATATHSRISAIWDQLSKDTVGSTLPVGRDYIQPLTIDHSADGLIQTHGTHTLGIAAGSGYNSPYQGIAPDADICLVNNAVSSDIVLIDSADIDKYTTATDALGFKYIFDYADREGKPCVASFSEGYPPILDQEDSLYAAFLDSLTGPGRIIVASAGNECVVNTYMEKHAGQEAAGAFLLGKDSTAFYRIRTHTPLHLSVLVYSSPTITLDITSERFLKDSVLNDTLFIDTDTCTVTTERYPSTLTNDTVYTILFTANKRLWRMPPIAMILEGLESQVQLYGSSDNGLANRLDIDARWNAAEMSHNIHAPACFPSVICVGATAHRAFVPRATCRSA